MLSVSHAAPADFDAIAAIDRYIPREELKRKLAARPEQVLVLRVGETVVGVLRWGLFWDYIPYVCFLSVSDACRGRGYAREALQVWEEERAAEGWPTVMASIPSDDAAQHFYRRMGYRDAGSLLISEGPLRQAPELFFLKELANSDGNLRGPIYAE